MLAKIENFHRKRIKKKKKNNSTPAGLEPALPKEIDLQILVYRYNHSATAPGFIF
jgi:hypothetical protein